MSDPKSDLDVENVISSIRRLLGEDLIYSLPAERLVLTPSQRVMEPGKAGRPAVEGASTPSYTLGLTDANKESLQRPENGQPVSSPSGAALVQPSAASVDGINPDELRALVTDVLREELRGELGERITRNLRKLIRREVLQALAVSRRS